MAWTRLAEAYADAGEQREAESAAERAQTLAEKAPLPLAQRYQIHAAVATVKEDLETAAKSYRELAALYPEDPDVQYRLAATLRGLGQQPEAIAAYQKVLQLSPGYGAAEIELAGVMWQAGRSETRSACCRRRSAPAASRTTPRRSARSTRSWATRIATPRRSTRRSRACSSRSTTAARRATSAARW
jgi:tetratricopeptide (TPR) repeat protein